MAESSFMAPPELAKALVGVGVKKARLPIGTMILLGILAGIYIGFAAHLATTVATAHATGISTWPEARISQMATEIWAIMAARTSKPAGSRSLSDQSGT